jgi:hypothetical protein
MLLFSGRQIAASCSKSAGERNSRTNDIPWRAYGVDAEVVLDAAIEARYMMDDIRILLVCESSMRVLSRAHPVWSDECLR